MSSEILPLVKQNLLKPISFFGINIKLWIFIALFISFTAFVSITILFLCCTLCRTKRSHQPKNYHIQRASSQNSTVTTTTTQKAKNHVVTVSPRTSISRGRNSYSYNDVELSSRASIDLRKTFSVLEIELATNELSKESVIGHGDCGTVYHGVLSDGTNVAIKKLLVNSCEAEEFLAQVEEIGHVRHKNLVNLLGFCTEGSLRMLVYEYVDNKSLNYWLHQCPEEISPLTWTARMNIIYGIAKGLEYLHEGIEQRILHRALKSSNVILDQQWNPKLTDYGVAKLFSPQWGFILMEALGYVAPGKDHNNAYNFTEKHDVYSFGVIILEIITGRAPIDRQRSQAYVTEWVKSMVASGNIGIVADPNLGELPCVKELKRIVLIALRCIDPDEQHRPSIRDVTLMFQPRHLLLDDDELHYLSTL